MCGIAGIFQFDVRQRREELERHGAAMARSMAHRGPDDEGVWVSDDAVCCLAHRRLSIIDPSSAGHQPMAASDGRAMIAFNGEIYNFEELRPRIAARGRTFATRTDTEVLLEAIRLWGPLAFPELDGMYALALYDIDNRELWLARDPFGEKPLYYSNDGRVLAFASELHALQQLPSFDSGVCEEALAEFLSFQYIGAPATLYRSVRKLPPGCFLRVRADGRSTLQRYFEFAPGVDPAGRERGMDDLADELEEILLRSIRRRLISDVPLGAFLSGGVDSSTVCALVCHKLGIPLDTFSIGFTGAADSEHGQARRFAERIGTRHHEKLLAPHATDFLLRSGEHLDEPNGDSSCLPTYLLSAFAREHVTVAISGDGGDEMFGGYGRYFVTLHKERRARRRGRAQHFGELYYSGLVLVFEDHELRELFGRLPGELSLRLNRLREFVNQRHGRPDLLMRMRKTDVDNYLPGAVLAKVDRMSMQHSLEVRTPFLSIELARFVERLPSSVLHRDGQGKLLLKHLAARYLPREWLDLPKRGFGLPLTDGWGRRELLDVVGSLLESDAGVLASVVGRRRLRRFLDRQRDPEHTRIYQLWAMGVLESYLQRRPAAVPAFDEAPEIGRLALPAADGLAPLVAHERRTRATPVVLFCREGVPEWWRRLGDDVTLAAPFAASLPAGAELVRASWADGKGEGLQALEGKVPAQALAVFWEPGAARVLTPEYCRSLAALGFDRVAVAADGEAHVLELAGYCELARRCRARLLPPGRRIGAPGRRLRSRGGFVFRGRWPLLSGLGDARSERARFAVIERRRPLLLADAAIEDIRDFGCGRYRVDERRIWLSTSDNSDPRANRRRYRLVDLRRLGIEPWWNGLDELRAPQRHLAEVARFVERDNAAGRADATGPRPGDTIALVTSSLHPGGAERQWIYLGRGLVERGFRVVLFAFSMAQEDAHYLPLAQGYSLEVRDLSRPAAFAEAAPAPAETDGRRGELVACAPSFLRRDLRRLVGALRSIRADWVACQLDHPNVCGGLAGLLAGSRRVLLSFRNVNPSNFSYLRVPWFLDYYRALERSQRIALTGNSRFGNADYAAWIGIEPDRVRTIHNGFSAEAFAGAGGSRAAALREELGIAPDALVVSGLFRLSEEKDPETFVEVARRLAAARPEVVVVQAGAGPRLDDLRRRVARAGLDGRVRLLGRRQDTAAILGASDLLLMTSRFEGLSNVLLEAQHHELPIVATAVGGTPEALLDGETGLLVPPGDAAEIARRCLELLDDPARRQRMGRAGRQRVETQFGVDRFVDATLEALSAP